MSHSPRCSFRITLSAVSLCLALGACGPSQEEYDAQVSRVQDLERAAVEAAEQQAAVQARLDELQAQNAELAERLRASGQSVEALEGERSDLQSSLEETRRALEELRAREAQAQARLDTFRSLIERFRAMIESGRLRVRIVRNRMVVELPTGVLFDSGRAELKDDGLATLDEVAQVLSEIGDREFQIAGHTDNIPIRTRRFRDNWDLSTARAVTVARYMTEHGVPANRISAAGHADTLPVASNDTPEGRAQNRRIEIVLLPNLDELPDLTGLSTQ